MSEISLKSITGITSITTPAGVDNQLTVHNNNTTEAVKFDNAGNVHINNQLEIAGVSTFSNGLFLPNEKKAEFGGASGTKLEMYHSSSNSNNSFIKHTGSGALKIASDHFRFRNAADSSDLFNGLAGDAITLYFAGQEKLSTTSDGIEIPDAIRHLNDANTAIRFPSNDQISFETGGSERGRFDDDGNFLVGATGHGNAGAGARKLVLRGPSNVGLTINSSTTSGIYRDCSIYFGYGTSVADMARGQLYYSGNGDFFHMSLDGSAYTMAKSFRLAKDSARFDSTPTTTNAMSLVLKSHKSRVVNDNNGIVFLDAGDHTQAVINVQKKSATDATSDLVFRTSSGQVVNTLQGIPERVRITSDGHVLKPYQVAFFAHCNISDHDLIGGAKFQFNTIPSSGKAAVSSNHTTFNGTNVFNTSTNTFTAPVAGLYYFHVNVYFRRTNDPLTSLVARVNNTEVSNGNNTIFFVSNNDIVDGTNMSGSIMLQLAANDAVTVHRRSGNGGTTRFYGPHSHFCGHLIG